MLSRARLTRLCVLFAAACLLAVPTQAASPAADDRKPLSFGVFAFLGVEKTRAKYQPLVDYLNQTLKQERVILKVLGIDDLENAITGGALDIVTTNPTHFLVVRKLMPMTGVIATLVPSEAGQAMHQLGGAIIARTDRGDIRSLADVRGKIIAAPSASHMGGYRAQAYELFRAGIRLPGDAARIDFLGEHQAVVRAVLAGRADVGFVRSGIVEMMQQDGSLPAEEIKLIGPWFHPGYPYRSSTRLYPEWPVFALPHVDEHSVRHIAAALFALESDHPAARAAGIHGYTVPADYLPVEELSRALRLPPFEQAPDFTLRDIWEKWQVFVILGLLPGLLVASLAVALLLALRRIRCEKARSDGLLAGIGEGVYGCDLQGNCIFINPAALQMLGLPEAAVLGKNQHLLFHHHKPDGTPNPETACPIHQTLRDGTIQRGEEWFSRADGSGFPVDLVATPMHLKNGLRVGAVVAFQDISQRKAAEQELLQLATTDTLTGLANRRHFLAQIAQEAERILRFARPAALLMLDLDHFKRVNDQHGHAAGDAVLKAFAQEVTESLRKTDRAGRLGGEEFAILLPETHPDAAQAFAERLRLSVEALPIPFEGMTLGITVSIGVTNVSPEDIESTLRRGDRALYLAKEGGRNRVELLIQEQESSGA
ncbi:MAG: diguanylate cyclase [Rhodocyclaceae bacterium]|nr:diguanylate cyclase [Rhodocyclaceae bacterium]